MSENSPEVEDFADRLAALEERNRRVESDKAWEISKCRKAFIVLATYVIVSLWLWGLGVELPLLHAAVPPAAFLVSSLTLPHLKRLWIDKVHMNGRDL